VTQHELFIRAAMEGRRDHVYQAAMFDPLTAATVKLDKIVEMCDELIAAHGDFLPKLEKKSLVHASGKTFGVVDPKDLRASWDKAHASANEDSIRQWQVIGPFKSPVANEISLEMKTPLEDDFVKNKEGGVNLTAKYSFSGETQKWTEANGDKKGYIDLAGIFGNCDFSLAYAYAEIESIHARETVLACGSDDGIRVWLNGKQVHSHEVQRGYRQSNDTCPIHLKAGINRILLKIDNYRAGWGFGASIPKANF